MRDTCLGKSDRLKVEAAPLLSLFDSIYVDPDLHTSKDKEDNGPRERNTYCKLYVRLKCVCKFTLVITVAALCFLLLSLSNGATRLCQRVIGSFR